MNKIIEALKTVRDAAKILWAKLPPAWQYEIYSGATTFVTAAALEMGLQYIMTGYALPTSLTAIAAIVTPGIRKGLKEVILWALAKRGIVPPLNPGVVATEPVQQK